MSNTNLYFIATILKDDWSSRVRHLQEEMCSKYGVCKTLNAPPHVTLVPPFRLLQDQEKHLLELVRGHDVKNFEISTNDVSHFGDRVIFIDVLPSDVLEDMKNELLSSLSHLEIQINAQSNFHPHITIGHKIPPTIFPRAWDDFKSLVYTELVEVSGPVILIHKEGKWQIMDN